MREWVEFKHSLTKKIVLEVTNFQPDRGGIEVAKPEDLPDELPHGVKWFELDLLIAPEMRTNPMMRGAGRTHFTKQQTLFYFKSFFTKTPDVIWLKILTQNL